MDNLVASGCYALGSVLSIIPIRLRKRHIQQLPDLIPTHAGSVNRAALTFSKLQSKLQLRRLSLSSRICLTNSSYEDPDERRGASSLQVIDYPHFPLL